MKCGATFVAMRAGFAPKDKGKDNEYSKLATEYK